MQNKLILLAKQHQIYYLNIYKHSNKLIKLIKAEYLMYTNELFNSYRYTNYQFTLNVKFIIIFTCYFTLSF